MINIQSTDMSDAIIISSDIDLVDLTIEVKLTSIIFNIVQNCSNQIFQVKTFSFF